MATYLATAGLSSFGESAPPETTDLRHVTTMTELWTIPSELRDQPVIGEFDITANYYDPYWKLLWGTDRSGDGYFPLASTSMRIKAGQRFRLSGPMIPAKGLPLATGTLTLLPDPAPGRVQSTEGHVDDVDRLNSRVVSVEGYVSSQTETDANHLTLDLAVEGRRFVARVLLDENSPLPQVDGARVRLKGVYNADSGATPPQRNLWITGPENIQILDWLDRDSRFAEPLFSVEQLPRADSSKFVHVMGTVRSQEPGESLVLRDDTGQVTLQTAMSRIVARGSMVEAVGLPLQSGLDTILRESLYRPIDPAHVPQSAVRGLPMLRLTEQVRRLNADAASQGYAVRLWGVVAWSHPSSDIFYLLDATGGSLVRLPQGNASSYTVGSRVEVIGRSISGPFAPAVQAERVRGSDSTGLPPARPITLEQAMTGIEEGQWVSLSGYVRTATPDKTWTRLTISTSGGDFTAVLPHGARGDALEGNVATLRGICRAITDANRQLTGIELWVPSEEYFTIDEAKPSDVFAEPKRPVASLRRFNVFDAPNHRAHLSGVVLYQEPGAYIHLQESNQSLMVFTRDEIALKPGDQLDVVGFPGRQAHRLILRESTVRRTGHAAEPPAFDIASPEILQPDLDGRLVRLTATIADINQQPTATRLMCQAHRTLFDVHLPRSRGTPGNKLEVGSEISITGVYLVDPGQYASRRGFQLQLRSMSDVAVVTPPPWWTAARTKSAVASLALATLFVLAWVLALRRRVGDQTERIRVELEKSARLEAELVRSSKLESLGVLAGGIAHDFNNLLTVIIGNLSLVLGDRRLVQEDEEFLRDSERAALRARDLTQQLLTFAKGGSPVRSAVLLPDIAREAAGFARHGSSVRCDFKFDDGLWPAHVDRGQISQVVHNIVLNAVQAMPTGGVVVISLANESISPAASLPLQPGRFLKMKIGDTGGGISPAHLARIFDPYFTTKQQGSGLGLATVYSIVKKHAGHIDVASELGVGTTFTIWLPASDQAPSSLASERAGPVPLTGRVLFMDDERDVRTMATNMLRRLGFEVEAVADGRSAIDACVAAQSNGRPFRFVMLDLTVPGGMGGRDALNELRRIDPRLCAIVSSGYSNDPVVADFRAYGFQGRVPKPYEHEELARVVTSVLAASEQAQVHR